MGQIAHISDPLTLFESGSSAAVPSLIGRFMVMVRHLYQYQAFKTILDLTASQIKHGLLTFKLHDQRFFDLDEGNCKTIYGSKINHFLNSMRPRNIYLITLKKLGYDVIIHEISHMVEKEGRVNLSEFAKCIQFDIASRSHSIALRNAIDQILVKEVALYQTSQREAELFARYFQIMAMSKEISGLASVFGYSIVQSDLHFCETKKWLADNLPIALRDAIDPALAHLSTQYIKDIQDIKHQWSEQKTTSLHQDKKAQWSKVTKSIKDY